MPKETNIKFKDFLKGVHKYLKENNVNFNYINKSGSARRFEIFENNPNIPSKMWVIHEAKKIYSDDFKKTCNNLDISKDELEKYIK